MLDRSAPRGNHRVTVCSSCGAEFRCGATADEACWCSSLPALEVVNPHADCLCPTCLQNALASAKR